MTRVPDAPAITVREALPADAPRIREVAVAAWRDTYARLIGSEAIELFLAQAYSEERIGLRIARHDVLIAPANDVQAFAEITHRGDHAQVVAIYAHPGARGRGLGTAILADFKRRNPGLDIAADVLIGNTLAEPFYRARGFEPGELLEEELGGELIRERRWWLRA